MEQQIQDAVARAVERLNEMRAADSRLAADPATVIAGTEGQLDSMDLINLLLFTEEELANTLGRHVDVMNTLGEHAASQASFTLGELAELIRSKSLG